MKFRVVQRGAFFKAQVRYWFFPVWTDLCYETTDRIKAENVIDYVIESKKPWKILWSADREKTEWKLRARR